MPSSDSALSPEQFEATLREAATGVAPADARSMPLARRLAPYRKTLLKFRHEGYSIAQLVGFLQHPKIGTSVSPTFLRAFLAPHRAKPANTPENLPSTAPAAR